MYKLYWGVILATLLLLGGCGEAPEGSEAAQSNPGSANASNPDASDGGSQSSHTDEQDASAEPGDDPADASDGDAAANTDQSDSQSASDKVATEGQTTSGSGAAEQQRPEVPKEGRDSLAQAAPSVAIKSQNQSLSSGRPRRASPRKPRQPMRPANRENYATIDANATKRVSEHPVSTFSVDVDTAGYANIRRFLNDGQLPPSDAVRTEELINYFDYDYSVPDTKERPFGVAADVAPTPWQSNTRLLRVGIQGWEPQGEVPPANLVFLVDVSGSMRSSKKLALLQSAMKLLTSRLDRQDRVSMVVYAGAAGVVLEPTPGSQKARIKRAIENLEAGGSTNGGEGIRRAYSLAQQAFIEDGVNRVMLATDGDFNVGTTDHEALIDLVERQRASDVSLTTLGFGKGNYNDHLVEQLANKGNGNHAYIDNLTEARRVLVENYAATLQTIAKDVKIQVEFNPATVAEYRLIGYENRQLAREDFNNDNVDAGEIGAGHTVTALYEVALVGSGGERMDPLRYGDEGASEAAEPEGDELAFLRLRYKQPRGDDSRLIERAITREAMVGSLARAADDLRFAAAVAGYGQLLRGGQYTGTFDYDDVLSLARNARGEDAQGRRSEFLQLVQLAQSLQTDEPTPAKDEKARR